MKILVFSCFLLLSIGHSSSADEALSRDSNLRSLAIDWLVTGKPGCDENTEPDDHRLLRQIESARNSGDLNELIILTSNSRTQEVSLERFDPKTKSYAEAVPEDIKKTNFRSLKRVIIYIFPGDDETWKIVMRIGMNNVILTVTNQESCLSITGARTWILD